MSVPDSKNQGEIRELATLLFLFQKFKKRLDMALKKSFAFPTMVLWATLAALPLGVAISAVEGAKLETLAQEAAPATAPTTTPQFALPQTVPQDAAIAIEGSESMRMVSQSLKQGYEQQFPGAKVTLSTEATETAINNVLGDQAKLASIGRSLSDAETAKGLTPVVLDREKIAIVVSEANPFAGDIGYVQFAKIFRGEIADWSELGGPAGKIRLIDRPVSSDTRQSLSTYPVFQSAPFQTGANAEALSADDTAAMVKQLGKDGVGYAIYSQVKDLPGIKVIPMHKVLPDNAAYPYSQPRVLVYKGEQPDETVRAFLGYATNAPGQAAIAAANAAEGAAVAAGENPTDEAVVSRLIGEATPAATATATPTGTAGATAGATSSPSATPEATSEAASPLSSNANPEAGATPTGTPAIGSTISAPEGDVQARLPGNSATGEVGGGLSPAWGLLPLLALAAGGGLLWWLAAGKRDDDDDDFDQAVAGAAPGVPDPARADVVRATGDLADAVNLKAEEGAIATPATPTMPAARPTSATPYPSLDNVVSPETVFDTSATATLGSTPEIAAEGGSLSFSDGTRPSLDVSPEVGAAGGATLGNVGLGALAAGGAAIAGGAALASGGPADAATPEFTPEAEVPHSETGTELPGAELPELAEVAGVSNTSSIESILQENRLFYPSEGFSRQAQVKSLDDYHRLYVQAKADPEAFWADLARQELHWFQPWDKTLEWNPPEAKWFSGGKLNITYNCLDRHLETDRRNKPAIIWEGEPGDSRVLTYAQLHREVCLFANSLKKLGIGKGDVVGIYMPMIPEAAIAMLACARIGAPHSVVFGGFSAEALRDRLNDGQAKLVITADGGWRKDAAVPLKDQVDLAIADGQAPTVENVLVVQRTRQDIHMESGRDHWWHDLRQSVPPSCPAEPMDSEDVLFILYTSGSTGKPKGVVHTTGGYNLYTHMTTKWIFDLQEDDIYWCTADVGWITGHSYIVYGPLSNGASTLMYEGAPRKSNPGCFWDVIEKYKVSIFYTAPTAIRAFIKMGEDLPKARDLSSLRLLGTVGEPINPEAWMWYHRVIGGERCPIVDTWWQTETGGIMISALPGAIPTKPGSATKPFPGIMADVVDMDGNPVPKGEGGYLIIRHPWPSMMRTVYGDPERFRRTYWEQIPGQSVYFAGDGARIDEDGYFWIMGRVDDVISVSGHRLGTMEIESALVSHPAVAEAAVVGRPDEIKGEEIVAFVTLEGDQKESETLLQGLKDHVVQEIGALARPAEIRFTDALPKTRSGKIMRRLLRKIASGDEISGDTSTLEDRSVLDKLRSGE